MSREGMSGKDIISNKANLAITRQCELLNFPRSTWYCPKPKSREGFTKEEERAMAEIDRIHLEIPVYGARKIARERAKLGILFGRTHIGRLMGVMGIKAVYPKPNLSAPAKHQRKFPYLLRGKKIEFPNQVWATDITYIPLGRGHVYLSAVIDWYSRCIVGWRLHDTMEACEAASCMRGAIETHGVPACANSDQGATYVAKEYVELLASHSIAQSMDGKGRWADNVIIERWFRSLKHECIYVNEYENYRELRRLIADYVEFYNNRRIHQALDYDTPAEWYYSGINVENASYAA